MLSDNDFRLLKYKLAKLLKTKQGRISKIEFLEDGSILVFTIFNLFPIKFNNKKEIDDDFDRFYGSDSIPKKLLVS